MPPKAARPPKKGSKKDLEAKAAKTSKAGESAIAEDDELGSDLKALCLEESKAPVQDDGGRTATGILVSEPRARDIKIQAFSLALHGHVLVEDTIIELNAGCRYGLIGRNGCGKVGVHHNFIILFCIDSIDSDLNKVNIFEMFGGTRSSYPRTL